VLGKQGTVRASCYLYNTMNEVDVLVSSVKDIAETMAR
jgi:selenocysteine lyase/cysteine desulfurase